MTCKSLYRHFFTQLQTIYSAGEASIIADRVFETFAGLTKSDIIIYPDKVFSGETLLRLNQALNELLNHKPLQQVIGEAWFYKMKFKVNEHVLIPRPETEELVEIVITEIKRKQGDEAIRQQSGDKKDNTNSTFNTQDQTSGMVHILDIGTGSGCIPVSLKKNIPEINITSVDISKDAIQIALENVNLHSVDVNIVELNFLDENEWERLLKYDIIISNPPYIPLSEKEKLDRNVVDYEPHLALFVPDKSPLLFYEKIALFGKYHLKESGKIFVETHEDLAEETLQLFLSHFTKAEIKKDIFGRDRFVIVQKK